MKRAAKAYKNINFLKSREARTLRILAEYLEPEKRFKHENINHTVVFFGSSRIQHSGNDVNGTHHYYRVAEELAYHLARFSKELEKSGDGFAICSGGGPGIMEAANRGADRAGEQSIGLNIALPHEQEPNDFISPSLNFEFNYFFMRKLWFLYHAKAIVFFPGGFGTMDELFETLTLVQTKKLEKARLPILLYDRHHWQQIINFDLMAELDLIAPEDKELFHYFDSVTEGLEYLKPRLKRAIAEFHLD